LLLQGGIKLSNHDRSISFAKSGDIQPPTFLACRLPNFPRASVLLVLLMLPLFVSSFSPNDVSNVIVEFINWESTPFGTSMACSWRTFLDLLVSLIFWVGFVGNSCRLSSTVTRELRRGGGGSIGEVSISAVANLEKALFLFLNYKKRNEYKAIQQS
jgi:hypothetical protein